MCYVGSDAGIVSGGSVHAESVAVNLVGVEDGGQKFFDDDVLPLSDEQTPGFLKQLVVCLARVIPPNHLGQTVVLKGPNCVKHLEPGVLVDPDIASLSRWDVSILGFLNYVTFNPRQRYYLVTSRMLNRP